MGKRVWVSRYSSFSIQLLHSQVDLLLRVDLNPTGRNNIDGGCTVTDEGCTTSLTLTIIILFATYNAIQLKVSRKISSVH